MKLYTTPNFLVAILMFITGLFVFLRNKKSGIHLLFFLSALSASVWQIGTALALLSDNPISALIATRIAFLGIALIPVFSYHLSLCISGANINKILIFGYLCAFLCFIPLSWTSLILNGVYTYPWGFFFKAGRLHPIFMIFFIYFMGLIFSSLFLSFRRETKPLEKNRKKYFLIALFIAYIGSIDYLPTYGVKVYPFGYLTLICFVLIFAYAILKFQIMDITVAFTRASIFTIVYAVVLGIPFWLGYVTKSWLASTGLAVLLATFGPFIYTYLRRHAENIILREQRRYQHALRELSKTMTRIRDLDKLLKVIVLTVVDTVKVSSASIYLKDEEYKSYRLKHCYPQNVKSYFPELIPHDSVMTKVLYEQKRPLLAEEVASYDKISLDSGLVIPCFIEDDLLGFLVLGAKPNHQMYTTDDVLVFETLSYSTSLAIENCHFWKEIEDRHRKARLQEMDTYSYSLAHEIDNPMQVVLGQADLLKKEVLDNVADEEKRKNIINSFDFILEAARRVSGMVKAIRDFGQKTTGELKPLKIEDVVESFAKLYYPKFKDKNVIFEKTLNIKNPVFVLGEKPELMQVLVILANNSIHAMTDLKEKKVFLQVETINPNWVRIYFSDNGYGIKKEMLEIIFTPFTTTKASTEGTGMGLYNAKKIIARHKGKIWAESDGPDKGATFVIELPVAKDIKLEELEDRDKGKRIF